MIFGIPNAMTAVKTTLETRSAFGCFETNSAIFIRSFSVAGRFSLFITGAGTFIIERTAGIKKMLAASANVIPIEERIPSCAAGTTV